MRRILFQVRTFRLGLTGNLRSAGSASVLSFLLPLLFQVAFGFAASVSGWLVAPSLSCFVVKPLIKTPDVALATAAC